MNRQGNQQPRARGSELALPGWIPVDAWNGWLAMRQKAKAPATPRAMQLIIDELAKLRDQGQDPAAVLDQSTMNGWKSVFPVRQQPGSRANEIDRAAESLGFRMTRPSPGLALRAAARAQQPSGRDIDQAARDLGFAEEWDR